MSPSENTPDEVEGAIEIELHYPGTDRLVLLGSLFTEIIFLFLSLYGTLPYLRSILAFPSLFIMPGFTFLIAMRSRVDNLVRVVVEGFFVSTIVLVVITSLSLALGYPLVAYTYSLPSLILTAFSALYSLQSRVSFHLARDEGILLFIALVSYIAIFLYFLGVPRTFTPDELSYLFSARLSILSGQAPSPILVNPVTSDFLSVLLGREFWIYLLAAYISGTGLLPYEAGLIGVGFLVLTALLTTLFLKNRWLAFAAFILIVWNPILILYSAVMLNDLAVAFYGAFSVLSFVSSFSEVNGNVSINFKRMTVWLLSSTVMMLVKPNILVFGVTWLVLAFILIKFKMYKRDNQYRLFTYLMLVPALLYEFLIDIPYVLSIWVLRNLEISTYFSKLLLISPINDIILLFSKAWWIDNTRTLYTKNLYDYVSYLYQLLLPESSGLILSSIILSLPLLILWKFNDEIKIRIQKWVVTLSLLLFYVVSLPMVVLTDVSRYSLWVIPIMIPISLLILKAVIDHPSPARIISILTIALLLLSLNLWMSATPQGIQIVSGQPPLRTWDVLTIELISFIVIIGLYYGRNYMRINWASKLQLDKHITPANLILTSIITISLISNTYFVPQFVNTSSLYKDPGLIELTASLEGYLKQDSLVISDRSSSLMAYVNDTVFRQGSLLLLPDNTRDLTSLFSASPDRSLFLNLKNDTYLAAWVNDPKNIMSPGKISTGEGYISKEAGHNITASVLSLSFDSVGGSPLSDSSSYANQIINHGAITVSGLYNQAINFNGSSYLTVSNNPILNVRTTITISFLTFIERVDPQSGYTIISKSDQPGKGYSIFISKGQMIFQLGVTGSPLSIPVAPYIGAWHNFIFTYDGTKIQLYVDGEVVASNPAFGNISVSNNDLEIGRNQTGGDYFIGSVDELQILNSSFYDLGSSIYNNRYLTRVSNVSYQGHAVSLFQLTNNEPTIKQDVKVTDSWLREDADKCTLGIQLNSTKQTSVTLILSTNTQTNAYSKLLTTGNNEIVIQTAKTVKVRIIVLENNISIYSRINTLQNTETMNLILLGLLLSILLVLIRNLKF